MEMCRKCSHFRVILAVEETKIAQPETCEKYFVTKKTSSERHVGIHLRLLRTLAGVLGEKICLCAILKENMANYISLESLINGDLEKIYKLPVSSTTTKMTMCHSIELIGYQIQAHRQNNCTVLIIKDQ